MAKHSFGRLCLISSLHMMHMTRLCFAEMTDSVTTRLEPGSTHGPPGLYHSTAAKTIVSSSGEYGSVGPLSSTHGPPGSYRLTAAKNTESPPGEYGPVGPPGSHGPPGLYRPTAAKTTVSSPGEYGPVGPFGPPGSNQKDQNQSFYEFTRASDYSSLATESRKSKGDTVSSRWFVTAAPQAWADDPSLYSADFSPIDFITDICPNTKFCQKSNNKDLYEDRYTCCLKCDCSDDCFVKGNCCHDKQLPNQVTEHETPRSSLNESCVFPMHGFLNIQELLDFKKRSVLIISSCSDNKYTSLVGQTSADNSCEKPELAGLRSIMDIAPVYSHTKRVSYSDKFCAMCNAETTSLLLWKQTTLSCMDLVSFSELFEVAQSVESFLNTMNFIQCIIEFHPPHNNSTGCLHQDAIISECIDSSHPKLRDLCQNFTAPFGREGKIYKNVFCFGCNEFRTSIYESACQNFEYGYGYDNGVPEADLDVETLENGLFVAAKNGTQNGTDSPCEEGFIYDQYLEWCVAYVCAPSKVNVSGKCLPVLKTLKNVGLDYKVKYRFLIGSSKSEKYLYETETINATAIESLAMICHISTRTIASLRDYHVTYITLVTRVVSEMTNVEKDYLKFRKNLAPLINREEGFETNLDNDGYQFLPVGKINFVKFLELERGNICPESIAMVNLQFCDAVMFPIKPEQIDKKRILHVKSIELKPSEYLVRTKPGNNTMLLYGQICRDLFLEKIHTKEVKNITNGGGVSTSTSGQLKMLFIAFCAVLRINV